MKNIKKFGSFLNESKEIPKQPFFVEAKDGAELDRKLKSEYGITPGRGIYYFNEDNSIKFEVFMKEKDGKSGWMVHPISKEMEARLRRADKRRGY